MTIAVYELGSLGDEERIAGTVDIDAAIHWLELEFPGAHWQDFEWAGPDGG